MRRDGKGPRRRVERYTARLVYTVRLLMRPYARQGKKIRINNRRKFNAGARRVSWEINPHGYPPKVGSLALMLIRLGKARRQGLTADQLHAYRKAMV